MLGRNGLGVLAAGVAVFAMACGQALTDVGPAESREDLSILPDAFVSHVEQDLVFSFRAFVPCAGEYVVGTITEHLVQQLVSSPSGHYVSKWHRNYRDGTAVGEITGDAYQVMKNAHEVASYDESWVGKAYAYERVFSFRLIGPGPGNNATIFGTFHGTLDANGVHRAGFQVDRIECT